MIDLKDSIMFGTEGSGNQKKFWVDNNLVKLDSKLRESHKEVSAYHIGRHLGLNCLEYERGTFLYEGREHKGVISRSYLCDGDIVYTLVDILNFYNVIIPMNMSTKEYFSITVDCLYRFTGCSIEDIILYLGRLLLLDFIVVNTDRHLSNIEFVRGTDGVWRGTPYYDFGQSFFGKDSVMTDKTLEMESRKVKMKPFSTSQYKNLCLPLNILCDLANSFNILPVHLDGVLDSHMKVARYRYKLLRYYLFGSV